MKIARLSERITIEKNAVMVDEIGNHRNSWTEFYSCYAYADTFTTDEVETEVSRDVPSINFQVRYAPILTNLRSTGFRVRFHDEVYNILAIDFMNYDHDSIKLRCKKEV